MSAALRRWRLRHRITLIIPTFTQAMDRLRARVLRETDCSGAHAYADYLDRRARR